MTTLDNNTEKAKFDRENYVIVRLTTTSWENSRGLNIKRSLNYMRRMSKGYSALEATIDDAGADAVVPMIINLHKCKDGLYKVVVCNESTDFETGYLDSWDFKLVPYSEDIDV